MMLDLATNGATSGDANGPFDAAFLTLVETIEALSSARSIDEVASVVRSSARQISGADGAAFEPEGLSFTPRAPLSARVSQA